MNCAEFQQELPEIVDGNRTAEQESHLRSCRVCSELVADLNAIAGMAGSLRASDEPSPRVWNSIEIQLRKEGLIRQPQREPALSVVPALKRWNPFQWLLPVAAAVLVVFGLSIYQNRIVPSPAPSVNPAPANTSASADAEDQQMLDFVSARIPAMREAYAKNLRQVNAYIRDAEESVRSNPNDEDAQQALMAAYEQKSVVYQMAMDRSLP